MTHATHRFASELAAECESGITEAVQDVVDSDFWALRCPEAREEVVAALCDLGLAEVIVSPLLV